MSKFHINKNGVPAACHAKEGNCPLGGNSGSERHFNSLEDAEAFVKQENEDNYGLLPGIQEEVTRFTKPNPDNIKNAIEKRFPGEDYTHEVFVEHYNVEETDDEKYKLTSIPMYAEVYFEDEDKDSEVVEFEYENTKDVTFDSEEEVEEYVDRIHLKLNGDEEDEFDEEVVNFKDSNPDNIKNAIEKRFPGEDYTHEVFVEHYNVEETDDGKYKLTSIPMHAEVYFEDEEKDAEVVEFEYENTKDITFDSEEEVEEYVDRIHLKLNGDEEDEEEAKWNAILNNDEYKVDPKVAEDSIRERVENAKSRMELDLKLAKELREEQ